MKKLIALLEKKKKLLEEKKFKESLVVDILFLKEYERVLEENCVAHFDEIEVDNDGFLIVKMQKLIEEIQVLEDLKHKAHTIKVKAKKAYSQFKK